MSNFNYNLGTSSGELQKSKNGPVLVGLILWLGLGTSTACALPNSAMEKSTSLPPLATNQGMPIVAVRRRSHPILELHNRTGLTWEQLASLFKVSRRAIHFWASGKAMSVENETLLQKILVAVRKIDTGLASRNRMLLTTPLPDGSIPLILLAQMQFERVTSEFGGEPKISRHFPQLPEKTKSERLPLHPEILADSLQVAVHKDLPGGKVPKGVRRELGS